MAKGKLEGRKVLVVEDEYFLADYMESALKEAGATVIGPVPSVEAALDLLQRDEVPEIAVVDLNLGGEPAYPIADALTSRNIPFLFTTGYDRAAIPARYAAVCRLEKPVEAKITMRELGRLLAVG